MKKSDITNLVSAQSGELYINPICTLRRWTIDPLFKTPVDRLVLDFNAVNGMGRFVSIVTINSRDYAGIIAEIETAMRAKMNDITEYLCGALRNGYTI